MFISPYQVIQSGCIALLSSRKNPGCVGSYTLRASQLSITIFDVKVHLLLKTRLTRWFIKPGVSPGTRQNRLRQHRTFFSFFTKILHEAQNFCEKA
jgi:hypothetical protein